MKKIKIAFIDFPGPCNPDALLKLLRKHFDVVIDESSPDFVFYSVFGSRYLEFPDAIRIFFTGENVHPDFNLCDYAFGFDWLTFEDRYCRCPNYLLYDEFEALRRHPVIEDPLRVLREKTKFCNFIYSNSEAHPFREEFFHRLNKYRKIDSAGVYLNNTGFKVGSPSLGVDATQDKIAFQRSCKFSIAIENSSTIGYTTEKLIHALAADTIPIYWGNPEVGREFNTKRFINCHEYDSTEDILARIKALGQDDEAYLGVISENIFPEGVIPRELREDTIVSQLKHIFNQSGDNGRRNKYVWGEIYERKRQNDSLPPTLKKWARYKIDRYSGKPRAALRKLRDLLKK